MTYRFRGDVIGRQECPSCQGKVEVFVFRCKLHGRCTEAKQVWQEIDGRYRVCARCPDRDACTLPVSRPPRPAATQDGRWSVAGPSEALNGRHGVRVLVVTAASGGWIQGL